MKNRRIAASLNKIQPPAERKEEMLRRILAQVDAAYASRPQAPEGDAVQGVYDEHWTRDMITLEPGVVVTLHVNSDTMGYDNTQTDRMDEHAITIRLDDYR